MQYDPLRPADPALAQSQLPPMPQSTSTNVAALSEAESTELIGLIDAELQFGWNNTNIELNLSPISLLLGMVVGCILTIFFRG